MRSKIAEGELAIKVISDISGGMGEHKKGAILRNLSQSAFTTMIGSGFGEAIKADTEVEEQKVDVTEPTKAPAK